MRSHKMFGVAPCLVLWALFTCGSAQGTFEDAETSKDYTSGNSNQQFDLRHTIPGEPEIDYPIYSEVPQTSFECTGRHEGYYADVESRCQAFRICAHTARSINGFGFLCPNGTLFSQKHFVCDWYRNVNCDESEQYYSKNDVNRIGSSQDMMETVRQMMEYPMKTISRALQRNGNTSNSGRRPSAAHNTHKKQLQEDTESDSTAAQNTAASSNDNIARRRGNNAAKKPVTRAQVESVHSYNAHNEQQGATSNTTTATTIAQTRRRQQQQQARQQQRQQQKQATESTENLELDLRFGDGKAPATPNTDALQPPVNDPDVYVNSLGELCTDPGVKFDHDQARIIAESPRSYNYGKRLNFAEKINAGLDDLGADLPADEVLAPEYVKNIRKSTMEATQTDLASNINGLLDEIVGDLDPSVSGYQVPAPQKTSAKHAFKFLSRGFSSQSEYAKHPTPSYQYGKPKQTPSTIRFSPNELRTDDTYKDPANVKAQKHSDADATKSVDTYETPDETIQFAIMTTTPKPLTQFSSEIVVEDITDNLTEQDSNSSSTTTTTTTTVTPATAISSTEGDDSSHTSTETLPPLEDYSFLSPPLLEPPAIESTSATDTYDTNSYTSVTTSSIDGDDASSSIDTPTLPSVYEVPIDSTTLLSSATHVEENATEASTALQEQQSFESLLQPQELVQRLLPPNVYINDETTQLSPLDEDKLDAAQHAAKLLVAGIKLTTLESSGDAQSSIQNASVPPSNDLPVQVIERSQSKIDANNENSEPQYSTAATTSSSVNVLANAESGSFQERIRNYRRYASLQRATAKPLIYTKSTQTLSKVAPNGNVVNGGSTTKPTSTTTTRSYLKRVAASRLRLSRLAAASNRANNHNPTAGTIDPRNHTNHNNIDAVESSKKLSVRNIDKELGNVGGGKGYDTRANSFDRERVRSNGTPTWESVRNNLKRYQVTSAQDNTATATAAAPKATRNSVLRARNRYANFKTQMAAAAGRITERTPATTTPPSTTTAAALTTKTASVGTQQQQQYQAHRAAQEQLANVSPAHETTQSTSYSTFIPSPNLNQLFKSISTSVSYSPDANSATTKSSAPQGVAALASSGNNVLADNDLHTPTHTTASSSSSTSTNSFLSFDKLTRAIVDDSVLQNFRSNQTPSRSASVFQTAHAASQPSESHSFGSPTAVLTTTRPTAANSGAFGYISKLPPAQATPQVNSPQRSLLQLPSVAPTIAAPRVVIARAEGQRIEPNSVSSIISALVTQQHPKATPATSYVPLDTFLTKKFGHTAQSYYPKPTLASKTSYYNQQAQQQNYKQQQQFYQQKVPTTAATFVQQQQQNPRQQNSEQTYVQTQQYRPQPQQLSRATSTAATYLSQQQQQLQQQQQYEQQQYKQQQFKQQQYFQQQQIDKATSISATIQQQQQQQVGYNTQSAYQILQPQQQQQTYYQTKFSTKNPQPYVSHQLQHLQPQAPSAAIYYPQQHQVAPTAQSTFTQNIVANLQQQQQQLPQFPPLSTTAATAAAADAHSQQHNAQTYIDAASTPPEHDEHLNVQLPALTAGLIPAPTEESLPQPLALAQKRSDTTTPEYAQPTQTAFSHSDSAPNGGYTGVSSYDVPLSSIGRLPNDITHLLRRLRTS